MHTLLSQFCGEFEEAVQPILEPLSACAKTLGDSSEKLRARRALPQLLELRHQLQQLSDKVAGQQAYVLIFGPLKSGKSTLMNAVASAYVSEVSCLPAYPCMVFVGHSEQREFVITRYNGRTETFTDPTTMRMHVGRAHNDLATRIREAEGRGDEFDPTLHFPEAIRRIDVKLPAGALEKSSAVLVDTPGLYSRMKFGYDRMTREFRNTAACAIFVVKTDNLFLEQVFEEFNELLELFSRIFLVVNLDTQKNDLRPDGTLAPSLEREDPVRVIEAFENLAMSAPLKAAAEDGRLRIYPVDLQRAAAERLQGDGGTQGAKLEADFDDFIHDLEGYLNSTDYLVAFLGDSLRHADHLMDELRALLDHEAIRELGHSIEELETERRRLELQGEVLGRLAAHAWDEDLARLKEDILRDTRDRAQALRQRAEQSLHGALDTWFGGDASLQSLVDDQVRPLVEELWSDMGGALHQALSERVGRGSAGLELPAATTNDLMAGEFQLGLIGRHALLQVDVPGAASSRQATAPRIDLESVPVKKSFWDWILFRSQASVRRRLFGDGHPTSRIAAPVKTKRLGDAGRDSIGQQLSSHLERSAPEAVESESTRIFGDYAESVRAAFDAELSRKRADVEAQVRDVDKQLREVLRISNHVEELEAALTGTRRSLEDLDQRYGEADPAQLAEPLESPEEVAVEDVEIVPTPPSAHLESPAASEPEKADS